MRRRHGRRLGMSMVEIAVSTACAATLLFAAVRMAGSTSSSAVSSSKRTSISIRVAEAADRLVRDLQAAGFDGEDADGDGTLDSGEDTNNNGVLDADWNLADGGSVSDFSFNRVDQGWVWSPEINYVVVDGTLRRVEGGRVFELARQVTDFTVSRVGRKIDISITASGADDQGEVWTETSERRTYVRN